jgi:hypothetical protein
MRFHKQVENALREKFLIESVTGTESHLTVKFKKYHFVRNGR